MQWGRGAVAVLLGILLVGVGVWRVVRAIEGATSSSSTSFTLVTPAPDPACANPQNSFLSSCDQNPCNPTTVYYEANNPGCQSQATIVTPTNAGPPPAKRPKKRRSTVPVKATPPPSGPVSPQVLDRTVRKQTILFASVKPDSLNCPPLPRRRGAGVTCHITGRSLDNPMVPVQGTARVTIADRLGVKANVSFAFSGAGGLLIHATGYTFDPDTGRVL